MQLLPLQIDGVQVYAGFWRRLGAVLVDFLVTLPLTLITILFFTATTPSIRWLILITILGTVFHSFYTIFFHYRFGATLGKMAVGIKVTQPDGSPINLRHAILRSIVDIFYGIMGTTIGVYALLIADTEKFASLPRNYLTRVEYFISLFPQWYDYLANIHTIWTWSELIVLLFNKRKRALHDFIAGTVVINKKFAK